MISDTNRSNTPKNDARRRPQDAAGEMPIPVFYTPAMVADSESFSPSAGKPALVVHSWQCLGLPLRLLSPQPLTAAQLSIAHHPGFVADMLGGRRNNGFGNRSPAVATTLPWTSGALLSAAREALNNRRGGALLRLPPCGP